MKNKKYIFLIGFMGCGKSTISRELSKRLGVQALDSDACIENEQNMKISDMFERYGEEYFRQCETDFLNNLSPDGGCIIACGGGMAISERNVRIMKDKGMVILLDVSPETVYERVREGRDRPLLNGNMNIEYISKLMSARMPAYESACDIRICVDDKSPYVITDEIVDIIV